jgi:hypothetical protein
MDREHIAHLRRERRRKKKMDKRQANAATSRIETREGSLARAAMQFHSKQIKSSAGTYLHVQPCFAFKPFLLMDMFKQDFYSELSCTPRLHSWNVCRVHIGNEVSPPAAQPDAWPAESANPRCRGPLAISYAGKPQSAEDAQQFPCTITFSSANITTVRDHCLWHAIIKFLRPEHIISLRGINHRWHRACYVLNFHACCHATNSPTAESRVIAGEKIDEHNEEQEPTVSVLSMGSKKRFLKACRCACVWLCLLRALRFGVCWCVAGVWLRWCGWHGFLCVLCILCACAHFPCVTHESLSVLIKGWSCWLAWAGYWTVKSKL